MAKALSDIGKIVGRIKDLDVEESIDFTGIKLEYKVRQTGSVTPDIFGKYIGNVTLSKFYSSGYAQNQYRFTTTDSHFELIIPRDELIVRSRSPSEMPFQESDDGLEIMMKNHIGEACTSITIKGTSESRVFS